MKSALYDIAVVAGGSSVVYGAWLAWPPAGWLIAGTLLGWWGVAGARLEKLNKRGAHQ